MPKVRAYTPYKSKMPAKSRKAIVKPVAFQPVIEDVPGWWVGNYPEYLAFWALKRLGYKCNADIFDPGDDVIFQKPELGGRAAVGGTVIDFVVYRDYPPLALPVNGLFWHPMFGPQFEADMAIFRRLKDKGWAVIVLDEDDLYEDAYRTVRLAIQDRKDISRYALLI